MPRSSPPAPENSEMAAPLTIPFWPGSIAVGTAHGEPKLQSVRTGRRRDRLMRSSRPRACDRTAGARAPGPLGDGSERWTSAAGIGALPRAAGRAATKVGKANRRTDTKPEVALRSALHGRGLRFRKDYPSARWTPKVRPDVVFTRRESRSSSTAASGTAAPSTSTCRRRTPTTGSRSSAGTSSGTARSMQRSRGWLAGRPDLGARRREECCRGRSACDRRSHDS